MNKILVIGGAGYIGSHVTYTLCDQGYDVIVLDDLSSGFIENIDKRAHFINDSYNNSSLLNKVLKDIDCVMHLAALKAAGDSMSNPVEYSKKNIVNSIQLINSCVENNVRNFIFSSSAAVYGHPEYLPINEDHRLNPVNYYGFTKYVIEKQLLWYNQLKDLNICCLRYFNAAGYDNRGRITMPEKNVDNLLPIVMEVASGKRKKLEIYGNDYNTKDGTSNRDYIHVNDLANAHVESIEKLSNNSKMMLNLSTGNYYSVLDVVNATEKITGKKIPYTFVQRRLGDPGELYAISEKASKYLRWQPKFSNLDTILESMWRVYNNY